MFYGCVFCLFLGVCIHYFDFARVVSQEDTVKVGEDKMQGREEVVEDNFTKGLRVLIIEDDPVSLKILESLMCNCKYHQAPLDLQAFSNPLESRLYELFSMNNVFSQFDFVHTKRCGNDGDGCTDGTKDAQEGEG